LLRLSSIDELPGLLNVLRGDMSIIGPRPLPERYMVRLNERQACRHLIRPGITGLAQVRGRNSLTWPEKLELDVHYVEHRSWSMDLWILAATVGAVGRPHEVGHGTEETMPEFLGTAEVDRPGLPDTVGVTR
jgi:lipopolysaccharide/colanic/teichoic acid biosynthesis glycosyltransferase